MTGECPHCGRSDELVDLRSWGEVHPARMCNRCGQSWQDRPPVVFRPWQGQPVHYLRPGDARPVASFMSMAEPGASVFPMPHLTVWCGPPADRPYPPTPEDLLDAAGINPGSVFL